jgi:hypothetical protein
VPADAALVLGAAIRPEARPTPEDWSCAMRVLDGAADGEPARRTAVRLVAEAGFSLYLVDARGEGR